MLIKKEDIYSLIPHAGAACLLECVLQWTDEEIICRAISHTDPANPFRRENRLAAIYLLEYGAQAMAIHGGLLARKDSIEIPMGRLVALHDVRVKSAFIEDIKTPLDIYAQKIAASSDTFMYRFTASTLAQPLADARATVTAVMKGEFL